MRFSLPQCWASPRCLLQHWADRLKKWVGDWRWLITLRLGLSRSWLRLRLKAFQPIKSTGDFRRRRGTLSRRRLPWCELQRSLRRASNKSVASLHNVLFRLWRAGLEYTYAGSSSSSRTARSLEPQVARRGERVTAQNRHQYPSQYN